MSNQSTSESAVGFFGCLLAPFLWVGGPLLLGYAIRSATQWPTWVVVIIAITLGGFVSHLLLIAIVLPLFGISSLFKKDAK